MEQPLVSIILPTYNVEEYLNDCLVSIQTQSYKSIEVWIIVDGSTDRSEQIAQNFVKEDGRFNIFVQENKGSGPARNKGLELSKGELIVFIDPDDWIDSDYIETLVRLQQGGNYDFVGTGRKIFNEETKKSSIEVASKKYSLNSINDIRGAFVILRFKEKMLDAPTQKIYKAAILKENNLVFPALRRSQDIYFNTCVYSFYQRIHIDTYAGYNYRFTKNSVALKVANDYYKTVLFLYNQVRYCMNSWGIQYDNNYVCSRFFVESIMNNIDSNVLNGYSQIEILEDKYVRALVYNATNIGLYHRVIRFLFLNKCKYLIKKLELFKFLVKKIR